MKTFRRSLAFVLAMLTILSALGLSAFAAKEEVTLYSEKFDSLSSKAEGTILTKDDGFGATAIPSTTKVGKDGNNTFVRVEIAAASDPNEIVYYTHNGSSFTLVDENTPGAIKTDRASYGLISGQDANLDKNLIVRNPEVSYKTNPKVALEVDVYLSEDAKGTMQFQMHGYTTNGESKTWLALFTIETATGVVNFGGARTTNIALTRGAWNTVTMVLDMKTGMYDGYINNTLSAVSGSVGKTNLEFPANKWIVGKIPRTTKDGNVASSILGGYFCLDNAAIYTLGDNSVVNVPDVNADGDALKHVEIVKDGKVLATTYETQILCTQGKTCNPVYYSFAKYENMVKTAEAASLRLDRDGGVRFVSTLDDTLYQQLLKEKEAGVFAEIEFGTLIAPKQFVDLAGEFTVEALEKLDYHTSYIKVPATYGEWYEDKALTFAGSVLGVQPHHYGVEYAGIAYVSAKMPNGLVQYFYGDYSEKNVANTRDLAAAALDSGASYSELELKVLNKYAVRELENGDTAFSFLVTNDSLLFKLDGGILCSLTNGGVNGWRLMAQKGDVLDFDSMGAAQSLSMYMGEKLPIKNKSISVEQKNYNLVTVTAEDGTTVKIHAGEEFAIEFYSKSGKLVSTVYSIDVQKNKVVMTGELTEEEGVYGGGERFDVVNKRGTSFELYTRDGWNNSGTSYMAIPVFSTTRGGGMFINRYEPMTVDFGKKDRYEWSVTLENESLDCYFFATEEIEDVLTGYVELTGHPDMPDEWMYGEIICRYSVDYRSFDVDSPAGTTNKDGAPSGRSVKTIISSLINAGMQPSAALMEPYGWRNISNDNEEAKKNAETMREMIEWLHSVGVKAMFYMGVAGLDKNMAGYKEEYQVRAYVDGVLTKSIPKTSGTGTNPDVSTSSTQQYLDITNPEAVDWYMDVIWGQMIELGADGIKIDFCECMPEEGEFSSMTIDYVWYDESVFEQGTVHHAYPTYFISLFYREMNEKKAELGLDDGFMVLSRGGGIGSQRNPYLWAGDQARNFEKLDDQLMAVINSGLSGVPFMTYDMAGYRYNGGGVAYDDPNSLEYESGVMARAVEFTAFFSNIQTHGTVRNAYELNDAAKQIYINYTTLHEELYDYITKYAKIACETGVPVSRHPVLFYQDDVNVYSLNDVFFLGDGLYVAPIYHADQTTRNVYLPAGNWTNLLTGETIEQAEGKWLKVEANLGQIPVFLNNDSADADYLREIFEGDTWTAIKNWK